MASPTPFVCARCLRAIRIPSTSSSRKGLSAFTASRSHSTAARVLASQTSSRFRHHVLAREFQSVRTLTTTTQTTSTPLPPPGPQQRPTDLSSSLPPSQTIAVLNPRKDPETSEPWHVDITPRAARRLLQIMAKDQNPSLCLRVAVESGGCHGFQYMMSLVDSSDVSAEDDTMFVVEEGQALPIGSDSRAGNWAEACKGKAKIVMDEASLELLKGSKVDYTMELIGSQFKIADNPRATSSCGCGTSFDVKI